ncbi:hypothetical protein BK389_18950 [Escherichia coli]|uniref:hypothetical protein n=1 Tax=Escherichia coli TaxID=562 RepID=UPI000928B388|nr:hypothetical protein [Escherichia coli]OJR79742.1 hypothetical protein BK389_18950 [Escherichia coli]
MKTLDVISTQLNFNNLLNQAGYNLSEIVVKRYSAAPAFNEGHWLFTYRKLKNQSIPLSTPYAT